MMRSFLVGGSGVFVLYALLQPTRLVIPAIWEGTFASIHAYMIYKILGQAKVSLTKDELRLYGMVFQRHDLEIEEFDPGRMLSNPICVRKFSCWIGPLYDYTCFGVEP